MADNEWFIILGVWVWQFFLAYVRIGCVGNVMKTNEMGYSEAILPRPTRRTFFETPPMCPKLVVYNTSRSFSLWFGSTIFLFLFYGFSPTRHHEMLRFIVFHRFFGTFPVEANVQQTMKYYLKLRFCRPIKNRLKLVKITYFHNSSIFFEMF